jgi:hypothetical protein
MKTLHKTAISAVAAGLLSSLAYTPAFAEDAPEASPITANVTVVNDYRYRGLTQSNFKPAIQGGFDYAHESGFYVGNWNSSISWIGDAYSANANAGTTGVSAPIEMDFYAGFKKEFIGEGFASDVGVLQYYYPTSGLPSIGSITKAANQTNAYEQNQYRQASGTNPSTTELYVAQNFTFGALTGFAKFSYALTPLFGIYNSKGSYYPDLTANYDTGFAGVTLNAHVGYQYVGSGNYTYVASGISNTYNMSYTDWKLGLTKDFGGGLSGSVAYVGTNVQKVTGSGGNAGGYAYATQQGANQGRAGGLISLTKTF